MNDAQSTPSDDRKNKPLCLHCGEPMEHKSLGWWCPCSPITYWNEAGSTGDLMPQ